MPLFTIDEVRTAAASAANIGRVDLLREDVLASRADAFFEARAKESERLKQTKFDIFLSHAYADKLVVIGLLAILQGTGFTVYVDWINDRHRLNRAQVTP